MQPHHFFCHSDARQTLFSLCQSRKSGFSFYHYPFFSIFVTRSYEKSVIYWK